MRALLIVLFVGVVLTSVFGSFGLLGAVVLMGTAYFIKALLEE